MAAPARGWTEFGWQGLCLRTPDDWNLGRVDGGPDTGYVRLDDAEIVRAEIEWRTAKRGVHQPLDALVERYLESLRKKASKAGLEFQVKHESRFLGDRAFLEGREYQAFTWTADYQARNLALRTHPDRIVLVRLLSRVGEPDDGLAAQLLPTLQDQRGQAVWDWAVFGMRFAMPSQFKLESNELRSGHIKLTFESGRELCRVERLSMARMLLGDQDLAAWYPVFFAKQLRELIIDIQPAQVHGHPALRVTGRPRSRFRQLMRPLPWISPRPRVYTDALVWHCAPANKICVVEHQFRRRDQAGDMTERIADGYVCHEEAATPDA